MFLNGWKIGRAWSVNCWMAFFYCFNGRLKCSEFHEKYWKCCKLCKGMEERRNHKCFKKNVVSTLDGFWQEPVRSSGTRGRSSEQAFVYQERCQKPVCSSGQWVRSTEQASGCCRLSEPYGSLSERRSRCVRSSEWTITRTNLMLPAIFEFEREKEFWGNFLKDEKPKYN